MNYKFDLTKQAAQPILSVRKTTNMGNLSQEIGNAYRSIIEYLGEAGEKPVDAAFAVYYNLDMENLDVEMGFPVSRPLAGKGEIKPGEIPAGKQVSCIYKGPYMESGPVYEAMANWVKEQGYVQTGVFIEYYYNSPMDVPESELITKIVYPLK